jgi:hypothetical protein
MHCSLFNTMQMIRKCHEILVKQFEWDDKMNRAVPDNYVSDTPHMHPSSLAHRNTGHPMPHDLLAANGAGHSRVCIHEQPIR